MTHARDETIDSPRIATCEARVRHYGEDHRDEVLLRSGHLPDRYEQERGRASAALAKESAAQEDTPLIASYAAAFVAEQRRLAAEAPALAALGELPAERAPDPEPTAPAAAAEAAPVAAPPSEPASSSPRFVPSYLREAPRASTPDVIAPPPPPVIPIHPVSLEESGPDATQLPVRRAGPTLPFGGARAGEIPDAVRAASAAAKAEREATDAGEPDERPPAGAVDIDETAFLPRSAFTGAATPFEKKKVEAAATVALDGDEVRAAAAAPEPWIPIEEYAAFLAELSQDPSRAGVLRAKYGIAGEDAQRALGAGFAAAFQREPPLRARFDDLLRKERARRAR